MKILVFLACLAWCLTLNAQVYRSVDKDGNVTYTDQPGNGAQEVEVKELETIRSLESPELRPLPKKNQPTEVYSDLSITSPADDESVRENSGLLTVTVQLTPALRGNDTLVLYMDGNEYARGKSTTFMMSNVDRGSHQLRVAVVDSQGRQQAASRSTTFHLQRFSVQH